MFGWGRYKEERVGERVGTILSRLIENIINDFRHLLALIIVVVFFVVCILLMWTSGNNSAQLDALKGIAASLVGLIGSIIGYYFGESHGKANTGLTSKKKNSSEKIPTSTAAEPEQEEPEAPSPDIKFPEKNNDN